MDFSHVNFGAVLVAAISAFALGGVWYGVFSKAWIEASGVSPEKQAAMGKGHSAMVFGVSFLMSVAAAFVFTAVIGPEPTVIFGLWFGFVVGLVWVAGAFGINYLFESKTLKLWAINGGYHIGQFMLYGLVFGLWH
ncbi:MAG: DUF1761 domain-containing protein [Gammaproteobacteria bacterium]